MVSEVAGPGVYGTGTMDDMMREAERAAQTLDLQLQLIGVRSPDDMDRAFSAISTKRTGSFWRKAAGRGTRDSHQPYSLFAVSAITRP